MSDPVLTKHADGTVSVQWPDPPRPTYEVAHEVIQMFVDTHNDRRARDERIIRSTLERYVRLVDLMLDPADDAVIDEIIAGADRGV